MNIESHRETGTGELAREVNAEQRNEVRESWLPELKNPMPRFANEVTGPEPRSWDDVARSENRETGEAEIHLKSGRDSDILNTVPCPANTCVRIDDKHGDNYTIVTTDDKGRNARTERPYLEIADVSDRQRNPVQTGRTFDLKEGRTDANGNRMDDGGHIVADEFGGSSEQTNLLPMDSEVNRHGAWRDMEKQIEAELKKEPPSQVTDYVVRPCYEGDSSRPVAFEVSYNVNGEPVQHVIINERPEGDVRNAA